MSNYTYASPPEQPAFRSYQDQHDTPYSQTYTNYSSVSNQAYTDDQRSLYLQSYGDQHVISPAPSADAASMASEKPSEAKPTLEPQVSDSASSHQSSTPTKTHLLSQRNDFLLDWTLKILGVASAILFGIWAPISYKITADANAGDDAAQASLMSEISHLRSEAALAASAQASLQRQMDNIGLIWAWSFCDGRADELNVCRQLSSTARINSAVSKLGSLTSTQTRSMDGTGLGSTTRTSGSNWAEPTPTIHPSHVSGSSPSGSATTRDVLAIILGSVFGAIVLIGLVVGILARRRHQRLRRDVQI